VIKDKEIYMEKYREARAEASAREV
jgi:hypothetical protein